MLRDLSLLLLAWEDRTLETGFDADYLRHLQSDVQEDINRMLEGLPPRLSLQRAIVDSWPITEAEMTTFQMEFGRLYLELCKNR